MGARRRTAMCWSSPTGTSCGPSARAGWACRSTSRPASASTRRPCRCWAGPTGSPAIESWNDLGHLSGLGRRRTAPVTPCAAGRRVPFQERRHPRGPAVRQQHPGRRPPASSGSREDWTSSSRSRTRIPAAAASSGRPPRARSSASSAVYSAMLRVKCGSWSCGRPARVPGRPGPVAQRRPALRLQTLQLGLSVEAHPLGVGVRGAPLVEGLRAGQRLLAAGAVGEPRPAARLAQREQGHQPRRSPAAGRPAARPAPPAPPRAAGPRRARGTPCCRRRAPPGPGRPAIRAVARASA